MDKLSRNLGLGAGVLCAVVSASAALAADLPVKAPVLAPPLYNWTGVYVGGHVGYGSGMGDWTNPPFDFDMKGFLGGGQIGVNQQIGNWVIGIEGEASWADIRGSQSLVFGGGISSGAAGSTIDRLATVTGRLGFAADRWLIYLKGGAAWAHETRASNLSLLVPPFRRSTIIEIAGSAGENLFGPMLGFGAEYAFSQNWSAKLEYNYLAFGPKSMLLAGAQTVGGVTTTVMANTEIKQVEHLVKLGVNYRFDTPAASANIAPSRPTPGFDWSGAYIGAQAAYGFGRKEWAGFEPDGQFDINGWLAGGTFGANAQAGVFVIGFEGELMRADIAGSDRFTAPIVAGSQTAALSSRVDWLAVASLRIGFVAADRWLIYGKGGIALAHERHTFGFTRTSSMTGNIVSGNPSGNALHTGYLAGVGVEHSFAGNWSAKLEYDYIDLRSQNVVVSGLETVILPGGVAETSGLAERFGIRQTMHLVKFGLNYHFSPLDVVTARY